MSGEQAAAQDDVEEISRLCDNTGGARLIGPLSGFRGLVSHSSRFYRNERQQLGV